jgi:hypothetical protein
MAIVVFGSGVLDYNAHGFCVALYKAKPTKTLSLRNSLALERPL